MYDVKLITAGSTLRDAYRYLCETRFTFKDNAPDTLMLSFAPIWQAIGLEFDVAGHSNKNHLFEIEEYIKDKPEFLKFITNASVAPNGLKMIVY